jgi:hypothetical protein
MPLISMYERDNSRSVYKMLSDKALQQFDAPPKDEIDRLLFKSLARLLEHYRYDAFSDREPIGVLDAVHPALRERRPRTLATGRTSYSDVRRALESAQTSVFGQQSRDQVVEFLQGILAGLIAGATDYSAVSAEDRGRAKRFFAAFSQGLQAHK